LVTSSSDKCSDCGEPLTEEMKKCPKCGSIKRTHMVFVAETLTVSESLGLRQKSGEKDARGKPIREARIGVKGNTETKITIDRSKRLKGLPETDVFHEVIKNGKTVHGSHPEPKGKRDKKDDN
jgi:hypothetical protein